MWKYLIINNMEKSKNCAEVLPSEQTALGRLTCSVVNHKSLTLTPCSQTKANVANCRLSKIRRNAGLQTGKPIRPPSRPRPRPRFVPHACLRFFRGHQSWLKLGRSMFDVGCSMFRFLFQPRQEFFAGFAVQPNASTCIPVQRAAILFPLGSLLQKPGVSCAR
jgi:hypothetical protein